MAQREYIDHLLSDDEIIVSKDDGTKKRRFTNKDEAEEYYYTLEREEVQDRIAKNQAEAVAQNKEIIANQERLIKSTEQNRSSPHQTFTRQILDPEYREWLIFQKETDPRYKQWKRKCEEELARQKAEYAEVERKRKEKEIEEEQKKNQRILEAQQKIAPLVERYLKGEKLTWQQRIEIASITNDPNVIKKLKYDNSNTVINALLYNPNVPYDVRSYLSNKRNTSNNTTASSSKTNENNRKNEEDGCTKFIFTFLIISSIVTIISILFSSIL